MKQAIILFFMGHSVFIQAIVLPSIFADQSIAQRVDRQRHLEEQIFLCKQEQPLVFLYFYKTLQKQDEKAWQELIQKFAGTSSSQDRQRVLHIMAAWMVQNIQQIKLAKKLDFFANRQEQKIVWVMQHGIRAPDYQKKMVRQVEKFKKFKAQNFDPYLISK